MTRRPLVIGGATATGKTALAVTVALRIGAELVNADSRQVMRRLRVGTATPTPGELRGVRCHLIDLTEPGVALSPPAWHSLALATLEDLDRRDVPAIVVGGTAQYVRALCEGWTFAGPPPDPATREALVAQAATVDGLATLVAELRRRDPGGAATIDLANPRRVVRAVETVRSGVPIAAAHRHGDGVAADVVILDVTPSEREAVIDARMAAMFDEGALFDEVAAELARGTDAAALAAAGIGYREAVGVLDGTLDPEEARARTHAATRRYAKAQRTAFRAIDARLRLTRSPGDTVEALADRVLAATATT